MDTITKTDTACEKFSSARYAQRMGTSSPCESQAAVDQISNRKFGRLCWAALMVDGIPAKQGINNKASNRRWRLKNSRFCIIDSALEASEGEKHFSGILCHARRIGRSFTDDLSESTFAAGKRKDNAIMSLRTGYHYLLGTGFSSISSNFVLHICLSGNKRRVCRFMWNVQSWRKRLPQNTISKCF